MALARVLLDVEHLVVRGGATVAVLGRLGSVGAGRDGNARGTREARGAERATAERARRLRGKQGRGRGRRGDRGTVPSAWIAGGARGASRHRGFLSLFKRARGSRVSRVGRARGRRRTLRRAVHACVCAATDVIVGRFAGKPRRSRRSRARRRVPRSLPSQGSPHGRPTAPVSGSKSASGKPEPCRSRHPPKIPGRFRTASSSEKETSIGHFEAETRKTLPVFAFQLFFSESPRVRGWGAIEAGSPDAVFHRRSTIRNRLSAGGSGDLGTGARLWMFTRGGAWRASRRVACFAGWPG